MEDQAKVRQTSRPGGPGRFALIGCLVVVVFLFLVFVGFLAFASRSPFYRGMALCTVQIRDIGGALDRYATKNDVYPEKLEDLTPDYIPASRLHCPSDKSPKTADSYIYHKPVLDAPKDTVVLECGHHRSRTGLAITILQYHKGGSVGIRSGR